MLPSVQIYFNALAQMLCASVEPFKKECLGVLFGSLPTKTKNQFIIAFVQPVQCVNRKRFTEIKPNDKSWFRLQDFFSQIPGRSRYLGDFHSHAEWGNLNPSDKMSDQDIVAMQEDSYKLEIIIAISSCAKTPKLWAVEEDGSLCGSFGGDESMYDFVVSAYVLDANELDEAQKPKSKKIKIAAPEFIKSFNRALNRSQTRIRKL